MFELVIAQKRREILRFAQNDNAENCHSERSEESQGCFSYVG